MASGGHSVPEVHLTVVVLWLTQKLAVALFSTPTFGSSATGSKEGPKLWTCLVGICLASFPGSSVWAERKEPGTHCLRMLSSPRISGNLEISVKSAPLHQPPQGMPTSPA